MAGRNAPAECDFQLGQHPSRVEVALEDAMKVAPALKVERHESTRETPVAEILDCPSLADLTGTPHDERAPVGRVGPTHQALCDESQHGRSIAVTIQKDKAH